MLEKGKKFQVLLENREGQTANKKKTEFHTEDTLHHNVESKLNKKKSSFLSACDVNSWNQVLFKTP